MQGDIEISVIDGPAIVKSNVCIEIPNAPSKRWDCMVAIVSKLDGTPALAFVDQYMFGEANSMQLETSDVDEPT